MVAFGALNVVLATPVASNVRVEAASVPELELVDKATVFPFIVVSLVQGVLLLVHAVTVTVLGTHAMPVVGIDNS